MEFFGEETRRRMSESAKKRCTDEWRRKQSNDRATKLPLEQVKELYASGHTQEEIGEMLGCTQKVVCRFMKNHGIKARVAAKRNQFGASNSNWKGGRRSNGKYMRIKTPADSYSAGVDGYILEHQYVMEKHIGRALRWFGAKDSRTEIIHHINGDKMDNRIENLQIVSYAEHRKIHNELRKRGGVNVK